MAYRVITPQFSFVRFSDQHLEDANWLDDQLPGSELGIILPACHVNDFAYQFVVETDTEAEADNICNADGGPAGYPVIMSVPGASLGPTITQSEFNTLSSSNTYEGIITDMGGGRYRLDETHILFYVSRLTMLNVSCGECFQMVFAPNNLYDYGFYVSNIFHNQCNNTDYTSVIDYYSELDEAGFYYCIASNIKNRARLPLYLTRPTYPDEEEVYQLSNNRYKTRKSTIRKSYEVETDTMPSWIIECLRAVFIHDFVFIEEEPTIPQPMWYQGEIEKDGAFDPQYIDYKNYPLAKVKFKVFAVDFNIQKNNCGECADYSDLISTTDLDINPLTSATPYTIDLGALTVADCCDPVNYTLSSYNTTYIASAPIINVFPGVNANVTFTTKPSFPPGHVASIMLIVAHCGGDHNINISATV